MSEEKLITNSDAETEVSELEENEYIVTFKKPFNFEGKVYTSVDLSGLEDLNGKQLCEIHKRFTKEQNVSLTPEMSPAFACITANMVTGYPIEFFFSLPAKELSKIKRTVSAYFFGGD